MSAKERELDGRPLYPIDRTPDMIFRALFVFA